MQEKLLFLCRQILKISEKMLEFLEDKNPNGKLKNNSIIFFDNKKMSFFSSWTTPGKSRHKKTKFWSFLLKLFGVFFVCFCFPFAIFTKYGKSFLIFVTKQIQFFSKKAIKYLKPKSRDEEDNKNEIKNEMRKPLKPIHSEQHQNLSFYCNQIPSQPNGEYINEILLKWYGNYDRLFSHKGYIQWLFPNREVSSNQFASTLTDYEVNNFQKNPELMAKLMMAFRMMLDFWGMELTLDYQFKDSTISQDRWNVLNSHPFLAMYITRILKTFQELNLHVLNFNWILYLGDLVFKRKCLPNLRQSFLHFWINVLPEAEKQRILSRYIT